MKHKYIISFLRLFIILFLGAAPLCAQVKMATYSPFPMVSTSSMLPSVQYTDDDDFDEPGTWGEPIGGNEPTGGDDFDEPQAWGDAFLTDNPDNAPIGAGWVLIAMAAGYALWCFVKNKQKSVV